MKQTRITVFLLDLKAIYFFPPQPTCYLPQNCHEFQSLDNAPPLFFFFSTQPPWSQSKLNTELEMLQQNKPNCKAYHSYLSMNDSPVERRVCVPVCCSAPWTRTVSVSAGTQRRTPNTGSPSSCSPSCQHQTRPWNYKPPCFRQTSGNKGLEICCRSNSKLHTSAWMTGFHNFTQVQGVKSGILPKYRKQEYLQHWTHT